MRIPLFHVDAFTDRAFSGNPAAVCILDRWLDDSLLGKVAAENNLPATAFLLPSERDVALRWFSPVCELKLCGHATLAAAFVLLHFSGYKAGEVVFSTRQRGNLRVGRTGSVLSMDFPALTANSCALPSQLLEALGPNLDPSYIRETYVGNETYVAVLASEDEVQNFQPDFARLQSVHPYAVLITAPGDSADFVSRYFAPGYGIPEDFVTGSSHCLLTPLWAQPLGKTILRARQLSARGGQMNCELNGDRVCLQGTAVPLLKGELMI